MFICVTKNKVSITETLMVDMRSNYKRAVIIQLKTKKNLNFRASETVSGLVKGGFDLAISSFTQKILLHISLFFKLVQAERS